FKVRTGEAVWSYRFADGVVNGAPIIDGNLIYCNHGEQNPEGGPVGRVLCIDASQIDPKTKRPKKVWEYVKGRRFGLASAALSEGHLYVPDDSGELYCFDAKNGKLLWTFRYGSEVRGAPLIADGKLYIFDVKGRLVILTLDAKNKDNEPEKDWEYKFRAPNGLLNETNGTPIAVNNHVYFATSSDLYCVGIPDAKDECGKYVPQPAETPFKEGAAAGVRIFPADVEAKAASKVEFKLIAVDGNGREVKAGSADAVWSLPEPPLPKGAKSGPPPLRGKIDGNAAGAAVALDPVPSQQGYVSVKFGNGLMGRARVRVVASIPYSQDFEKVPVGAVPGGWVNTQAKYLVVKLPDGKTVLSKVNTDSRPPFARANAYITLPSASNYTIQADVMGTLVNNRLPDIGLVNSRYTLILDGKTNDSSKPPSRELRIVSWEARAGGRVNEAVDFNWEPNVWYTTKFTVEQKGKTAMLRGKVWKQGEKEPEKWTVEFEDPSPNPEGSAALYGYISDPRATVENPGSAAYYDNLKITPNK
ncbi:MAG TPA: PQQ-binding-like beta-propeller repeat protein, partial [Urbifossiella sp.]